MNNNRTFAVIAHCRFTEGPRITHWMHELPPDLAPLPHTFVASIMDNRDTRRLVRGSVICKSDAALDHAQMKEFARALVESIPALAEMLLDEDQSVIVVGITLRDPGAILGEEVCESVFLRQFTQHQKSGEA
jgi:hypothetical protein